MFAAVGALVLVTYHKSPQNARPMGNALLLALSSHAWPCGTAGLSTWCARCRSLSRFEKVAPPAVIQGEPHSNMSSHGSERLLRKHYYEKS